MGLDAAIDIETWQLYMGEKSKKPCSGVYILVKGAKQWTK